MPNEKPPQKEQIKVTDKRMFTADGEIREEFRDDIKPVDPNAKTQEKPAPKSVEASPVATPQSNSAERRGPAGDRRRTMAGRAADPGTAFTNLIQTLGAQAYMSLGLLPNPYQQQSQPDAAAARQLIDILSMLHEKTAGNLTPEEDDFLNTFLGELKLTFVKITKNLA